MKVSVVTSVLLIVASIMFVSGCDSSSAVVEEAKETVEIVVEEAVVPVVEDNVSIENNTSVVVDENISDGTSSILTQDLKDAITFMYNEEGLAYDVYMNIYDAHTKAGMQTANQLKNIAENSETKHMEEVDKLAVKYDLNITKYPDTDEPYSKEGISSGKYSVEHVQELYDLLYEKGIQSKKDALEVGCMVEVVDIDDLNGYIRLAEESNASDVLEAFNFLRNGSYTHYWAFDDGLKKLGISEGCCSVPDYDGHHFCQPDYPKK